MDPGDAWAASARVLSLRRQEIRMKIPRILHQIWIGPHAAPSALMVTWKRAHPDWAYRVWTNEKGWRSQAQIDAMREWNGKADIMRYEILLEHGGVCFDADAECVRPLDDAFLEHEAFACWENEVARPGLIATGYLGARPGSPIMRDAVEAVGLRSMREPAWICTGPMLFTEVAARHPELHVYPARTFIPEHYSGLPAPGDAPIYARQFWGSTRGYDRMMPIGTSNVGRWDRAYQGQVLRIPCGEILTYERAAEWLNGLAVEDWGCGLGWFSTHHAGDCIGIDGSKTAFGVKQVDLCGYRSETDGLLLRHVLEHNVNWKTLLQNALASFRGRMVLILSTPLVETTSLLDQVDYGSGPIAFIGLGQGELEAALEPYLVRAETHHTGGRFGVEHVFYLEARAAAACDKTPRDCGRERCLVVE